MKSKIASRAAWALVVAVGGVSAVLAADSQATGEREWWPPFPVHEVDVPDLCEFTPSHLLGSEDLQSQVVDTAYTSGVVKSFACGMQIQGYGHMYTEDAEISGAAQSVSKSSSGFGTVTVRRTRAGSGHVPHMTLDWFPKFKAEAKVVEPDASCMVAGLMQGECHELDDAGVCASGGALADGKERDENLTFKVRGIEFGISSRSGDDNTAAPIDAKHREKVIDAATAAFSCDCTVKATVPGSFFFDWTQECEAWIWDCFPELDLHGNCGQCGAYGYGSYGWTL
jgi:hypothetical protein